MVGRIVKKDEIAENSIVMTKMIHADANKSFFPQVQINKSVSVVLVQSTMRQGAWLEVVLSYIRM